MKDPELETHKLFIGDVNVRKNTGNVDDLAESIKEKGMLQPLIVRPSGNKYEVVVGSRRLEAAKQAGLKKVPAVVTELDDDEAVTISLTENIQREAINPEEEYDAFLKLRQIGSHFDPPRYQTDEEIAEVIGKSRRHVSEIVRAVSVIKEIRSRTKSKISVKQGPSIYEREKGVLPVGQAALLARAEQSRTVQELSEKKKARKLEELAETIAPLPKQRAERVVEHFVMSPERPMDSIKQEAMSSHVSTLTISLEPPVADALRKAATDKGMTMEKLAAMAIELWLKSWKYL
jgi:ParB family chromosome partitioning protein